MHSDECPGLVRVAPTRIERRTAFGELAGVGIDLIEHGVERVAGGGEVAKGDKGGGDGDTHITRPDGTEEIASALIQPGGCKHTGRALRRRP